MPQHPFELLEGIGQVLQLVVKVDVFLDQSMDGILKLKGQRWQDEQGEWRQEEQRLQSPHCSHGAGTKITSSDGRNSCRCKWKPFEENSAQCRMDWHTKLSQQRGGDYSLFLNPLVESCRRAALKSIHQFHTSDHSRQNIRMLLYDTLKYSKRLYTTI